MPLVPVVFSAFNESIVVWSVTLGPFAVVVTPAPALPVSAWVWKLIVLTVPPVALASKPDTKLSGAANVVVMLPLRTFVPLKDAPLTASVNCAESDANVVLIFAMSAPGLAASVMAVWIELIVVMTELIAEVAVSKTAWLWARAEFAEVTMPLSELSCWPIDQWAAFWEALATARLVETWFWVMARFDSVMFRDCSADSAEEFVNIELTLMGVLSSV